MSFVRELMNEYADRNYTPADVLSKVSAVDKEVQTNNNTTKFGLQDSNGEIVLVYVDNEQAEDFEQAMARALADVEEATQPEIAEVLFNMHDQFNIVNVEWPGVVEDEEEDSTDDDSIMDPESESESEGEGELDGEDMGNNSEEFADAGAADGLGDEGASSTLDAVIQMMVADSEAKRQEALARAAEARAKEAEAAAKIADGKLRAEEEVADMEAYYDTKNQEQKEAKKLAKLAKYRHDAKATDMENDPMDYGELQGVQGEEDMQGYDTANRDTTDPVMPQSDGDDANSDTEDESPLDGELDDFGVENEESGASADGPGNVNRQFKEIEDAIKYLHSLQVQKQAVNN